MPPPNRGRERILQEPCVIRYDTPAYDAHAQLIIDAATLANQLGMLTRRGNDEMFQSEHVVGNRPRTDDRMSASRWFFAQARRLQKDMEQYGDGAENAAERRALLFHVLGIRLSMGEAMAGSPNFDAALPPVEPYAEIAEEVDVFCAEKGIPSVLPNMFEPASLGTWLERPEYDPKLPDRMEFFGKLVALFAGQDHHLHATLHALEQRGMRAEILPLIAQGANDRGMTVDELLQQNVVLAQTYVRIHRESQNWTEILRVCDVLGEAAVRASVPLFGSQLFALVRTTQFDRVLAVLDAMPPTTRGDILREQVRVACVDGGWWLYGNGEYGRVVELLERHLPDEIRDEKRDAGALYAEAKRLRDA